MKSKIIIFETNKLDGKMSKNPKFYPKETTEEETATEEVEEDDS